MKHFKKLDKFGEKFSFNYNGYDKYSSRIGGAVCLILCLISLSNFIINLIPFIRKENYTLQFYSVNSNQTENITLDNSIIFGIDCGNQEKTQKAYDDYFEVKINFSIKNQTEDEKNTNYSIKNKTENENNTNYNNKIVNTTQCKSDDFNYDSELYDKVNNLTINELKIENFTCLEKNEHIIRGIYTDEIFAYYKITVSAKEGKDFSDINDFLFQNDCKLQFYYIDYNIDITNYKDPYKPLINSLFLQLNPDFYIKKNVFFMNYHFKNFFWI